MKLRIIRSTWFYVVKLRHTIGKAPWRYRKATMPCVKAESLKTGKPALCVSYWTLYIWYKLIDGNKQPLKSNFWEIPSIKEFPISIQKPSEVQCQSTYFFFFPNPSPKIPVFWIRPPTELVPWKTVKLSNPTECQVMFKVITCFFDHV